MSFECMFHITAIKNREQKNSKSKLVVAILFWITHRLTSCTAAHLCKTASRLKAKNPPLVRTVHQKARSEKKMKTESTTKRPAIHRKKKYTIPPSTIIQEMGRRHCPSSFSAHRPTMCGRKYDVYNLFSRCVMPVGPHRFFFQTLRRNGVTPATSRKIKMKETCLILDKQY